VLPEALSDVIAAAAANPGMSSWAALNERAKFQKGEAVLINGATGAAGRLAIQIAKYLGASKVVVTGRNSSSVAPLLKLGADSTIALDQSPQDLVSDFRKQIADHQVSVILDYLWGPSAESILAALTSHNGSDRRTRYVQIGSIAGQTINFPAAALRSSNLEVTGSGLGSVSNEALMKSIEAMMNAIIPGQFQINADPIPLSKVESAWQGDTSGRIVFVI